MNRIAIILLIFVTLTLSSCVKPDDIAITDVASVKMNTFSSSALTADIEVNTENRSARNITLIDGELELFVGDKKAVKIILREKVLLTKRSQQVVILPIGVSFTSEFGTLGLIGEFTRSGIDNVSISGYLTAKAGMARKKIKLQQVPLQALLSQYGINANDLIAKALR